jgi:hypothetical protein
MGKANPSKWLKAVTKAFRSPAKLDNAADTRDDDVDDQVNDGAWSFGRSNLSLSLCLSLCVQMSLSPSPCLSLPVCDSFLMIFCF